MPPATPDPPPPAAPDVVARFTDALLGERGRGHGHGPEQEAAELVRRTWPAVTDGVLAADAFHGRAAERAVAPPGGEWPAARGVIFAGFGYPPPPCLLGSLPHVRASRAAPDARFGYSSGGEAVTMLWQYTLAGHPQAWLARGDRPRDVLRMAAHAGLRPPYSMHLRLALHWLPPDYGRKVVAAWAQALPPGSSLVMSAALPGPRPQPPEVRDEVIRAVARSYQHSPEDIASWVEAAGMRLDDCGVTDVRRWPLHAAGDGDAPSPGWFAGAVALRP